MIAIDTNLLVYAHRADAPFHGKAAATLRRLAEGNATWGLPWPCVHEFLAIVTHPGIFDPPTPLDAACTQVRAWLESPSLVLLAETGEHWRHLEATLIGSAVTGPRVHDARVAAICVDHGVRTLWTVDRDFSRFPDLPVTNPLRDED